MNNLYCPYCEHDCGNHIDDCYNNDVQYEYECPNCEKNFTFRIEYYPTYSPEKAPCLNGEEHKYKPMCGLPRRWYKDRLRCEYCEKEIKKEDLK